MLWRKLWADSRALARQAAALVVLICLGVLLYVGLYEAYQNLDDAYNRIYRTTRFADASVLFEAAPESLIESARTIPHVRAAIGRIVKDGSISQGDRRRKRVMGRFVGVPRRERSPINDLWIVEGQYISDADEVLLEHQFAGENGYRLGDPITCSYLSRQREFTIAGFVLSPEYVYPVPSKHSPFVSPGTFGVVFLDEDRAREWLGVGRQITEIHCLTDVGREQEVLEKLEALARPYGLETAFVQDDQPSKRLLTMDQQGFATLSVFFPILFLASAALSLYGALSRIVRLQVPIIGTLKACGFTKREILIQYVMQGVLIGVAGAIPGAILGHWLAVWLNGMYLEALHIPIMEASVHWDTVSIGFALAVATGFAAAYLPARMAARMPPAAAMRGETESARGLTVQRRLVERTRFGRIIYLIPLRGVFRRVSRTILALGGIAGGVVIIVTTFGMHVSTMDALDDFLTGTRKYDIDLQFTRAEAFSFAESAAALPGAKAISLTTSLPIRARSSWGAGELILTGLERNQQLLKVKSESGRPIDVEPGKIWIPHQLADRLMLEPGDPILVEWVQSSRRRPVKRAFQVAGIVDAAIGNSAYGEFHDVRRSFADAVYPHSSYGALFACDAYQVQPFRRRFEESDELAAVSTTEDIAKHIEDQFALMLIFIGVLLSFGLVLAGSAIHSVATVSLLERTRELATLRSLGFSAQTTAWISAIELCVLSALGILVGIPLGKWLNQLYIQSFTTESLAFRAIVPPWIYFATVFIVYALVGLSSWGALRRLRTMDLAQATKARE
jgi:putative ABC transport system permease protein